MSIKKKYSIGCDIGGSHISCGIIDIASGVIEDNSMVSIKVDNSAKSEVILQAWTKAINKCINKLTSDVEFVGVGLAIPGPFDYVNGIGLYDNSNQKFVHLKDVNVKKELSERLEVEDSKIKFTNDATAFALGSFWYGSGKGFQKMVAITLGTGFGSSFINNGKAIETGNSVPKEGCLWHIPYKDGIADDYFSTRWFVDSFNIISDEQVTGVKRIAEMANEGNEKAIGLFKVFGENLADCLAEYLEKFKAEVVVLGGNIAEAFGLFERSLQESLQSKGVKVAFKVSILKESAAMLGAVTKFK
jgi:glucokinase